MALGCSPSASISHCDGTIACDVTLAYPDCLQGFEIYTDSSKLLLLLKTKGRWHFLVGNCSGNTKTVQRHALGT